MGKAEADEGETPATDRPAAARIAFGETADPDCYVARPETERALAILEAAVLGQGRSAAVIGSPGMGKSLLLRLFGVRRKGTHRVVYLPYAALDLAEFCAWVLGLLGEKAAATDTAVAALQQFAARTPLLLLIDEASSLPPATARRLGDLVRESANGLQLALAASDDARSSRALAALGLELGEARLRTPMSEQETAEYVSERIRRADVCDELAILLGGRAAARIHALAGGVPRRVHDLALRLIEEGLEAEAS